MSATTGDIWPEILNALYKDLPDRTVKNWFESAEPEIKDSTPPTVVLEVPTPFHRSHIRSEYCTALRAACEEVLQHEAKIEVRVGDDLEATGASNSSPSGPSTEVEDRKSSVAGMREAAPQSKESGPPTSQDHPHKNSHGVPSVTAATTESPPTSARSSRESSSPIRPDEFHRSKTRRHLRDRYTFDNFVEGDSNALAKSASTAVSRRPGESKFNPLLIYGGVGLGKTHLAQAIANYAIAEQTAKFVCYTTSEKFTSEFVQAIRDGDGNQFAKKYRGLDLLIVDDIQFFGGKEKTQEEFFHLFNELYQRKKQIVLCADRPPQEIVGVQERLLSRFKCGLSTDVQQPNLETRLAILQLKAEALDLAVEQEVLDLMAKSITTNIRDLEGALKQLAARADLTDSKVDVPTAQRLLENQVQLESTSLNEEHILKAVAAHYGVSHDELVGRSRVQNLVHSRHVAMYFCRELTNLSLSAIGLRFGGRDHSTVSHACQKINDRLDVEPMLEEELTRVKRKIQKTAAQA